MDQASKHELEHVIRDVMMWKMKILNKHRVVMKSSIVSNEVIYFLSEVLSMAFPKIPDYYQNVDILEINLDSLKFYRQ